MTIQTPKERFVADKQNVTAHVAMLERDSFDKAIDVAMLEFQTQLNLGPMPQGNEAAARFYRLLGAHEFSLLLKTMADSTAPLSRIQLTPNLDHKA
ncbi:MAG TPA: hypothetical protein VF077_12895 [Nitrospiraceae bacterium]